MRRMADSAPTLTLDEAAAWLYPPVSAEQLRQIVNALKIKPVGKRQVSAAGRPAQTFDAAMLMRLHTALAPWLQSDTPET